MRSLTLFTGRDVDAIRQVLLDTPYPQLKMLCRANRHLKMVCDDETNQLWPMKLVRDFGEGLERYRLEGETPRKQYHAVHISTNSLYLAPETTDLSDAVPSHLALGMYNVCKSCRLDALIVALALKGKALANLILWTYQPLVHATFENEVSSAHRLEFLRYLICATQIYDNTKGKLPFDNVMQQAFTSALDVGDLEMIKLLVDTESGSLGDEVSVGEDIAADLSIRDDIPLEDRAKYDAIYTYLRDVIFL